jgi:magnesium transporter
MLRSLVVSLNPPDDENLTIRRNLSYEALEQAIADNDLLWLDIVDPTDEELQWLESCFKLHPVVVTDLRREDRRPALHAYPEYLFLSLFQGQLKLAEVLAHEIHCIISEQYLITTRSAASVAVDSAYERAAQNTDYWKRGVGYFLYLTIQFVTDAYYPLLDRISNQLNTLEEEAMKNGGNRNVEKSIYRIKHQLISLRQMVAPQREVLSNAIGEERLAKTRENRELFRHLYERLLRVYDVIDSQRDLASNVLDLIESQQSSRLANAVGRLTVFSMIFLPLTFLVGLFGLNFVTTAPEFEIPLSGALVFLMIIIFTLVSGGVMAWYFRRRGWL